MGAAYGRRLDLIGRMITVSDRPVDVIGVVPVSFRFEDRVDLWLLGDRGVPRFTSIPNLAQSRDVHILTVVGRLRRDVSIREAQAELDVISARLAQQYPATNKSWGVALDPLQSALVGHTRRMLVLPRRRRAHAVDRIGQRGQSHAGPHTGAIGRARHANGARRVARTSDPSGPSQRALCSLFAVGRSASCWQSGALMFSATGARRAAASG